MRNCKVTTAKQPADKKMARLGLDVQLCFALYSASLTMTKVYKPLLSKLGLTYPQYLVMLVLWEEDQRSVSKLGELLFLDSGTLTPLLKRLETLAFVTRTRDECDERRVIVALTVAGRQLRARALAVHDAVACTTRCSANERAVLTQKLNKLRSALAADMATSH